MKTFNLIFIVLFIIFAALQYNDPDPYVWMPIYLYAAWLCYKANKGEYNRSLYLGGLTVYMAYSIFLFVDSSGVVSWLTAHNGESIVQTMKAEKPWIEETREFFGLVIVMAVLGINMRWLSEKKKTESLHRKSIWI